MQADFFLGANRGASGSGSLGKQVNAERPSTRLEKLPEGASTAYGKRLRGKAYLF